VSLAVSSDGRFVVTQGGTGVGDMLYVRALDDFEAKPITGTPNARNPELSPDDQWVAFLDATGLRKVRVGGGPSVFVTQFPSSPDGIHWGADDHIYYAHQGEVWRVRSDGGDAERLIENDLTEQPGYGEPFLVPGTSIVLCSSRAGPGTQGQLYAFDLESKTLKSLDMTGTDPRYLPTGHVLFAQGSQVFVAPFDLGALAFTGQPSPALERAWIDQGQLQVAVSRDGTVAYLPRARGAQQSLVTVDLAGKVEPLLADDLPFTGINDPRVSPDGRRVMITVETGAIWMIDLDTQTPTLMSESGFYPLWSPDGSEIVYSTSRNKTFDIFRRPVDLSAPETLLLDLENNARTGDWTADGALVVREEIPGKGMDLRYWPDLDDPSSMVSLMDGPDDELAPVVSADGEWLAYVSNYSGTDEIYVTSFPVPGPRLKISVKGGNSPTWAPDGKTLYYLEDRHMIAVTVETAPRFRVIERESLFEGEYIQYRWSRQYDILPDGKRFVMVQNPPRGNIEVVTRWFDEIRGATE
jgi:Tol biopolymer transport system component